MNNLVRSFIRSFSWICNPAEVSISIYNAMNAPFRIKNPDTQCGRITNPPEREKLLNNEYFFSLFTMAANPVRTQTTHW